MNLSIKYVLLVVMFLAACGTEKEYQSKRLQRYVEDFSMKYEGLTAVLVLSEAGCPNCTKVFSALVQQYLKNPSALCIVNATGSLFDIAPYQESERVLLDYDKSFRKLEIHQGSCSIFLNEKGVIDTIIAIQPEGLKETLQYIEQRLNKVQ